MEECLQDGLICMGLILNKDRAEQLAGNGAASIWEG